MRMRASPTRPPVGRGPGGPPEGNAIALSGGGLQGIPKGRKVSVERRAASGTPLDTALRETRLSHNHTESRPLGWLFFIQERPLPLQDRPPMIAALHLDCRAGPEKTRPGGRFF